jgi:hypothetical protein
MAPRIEDMTEDNVSLDNIEGGDDSNVSYIVSDFMPVARDIMNRDGLVPSARNLGQACTSWRNSGFSLTRKSYNQ